MQIFYFWNYYEMQVLFRIVRQNAAALTVRIRKYSVELYVLSIACLNTGIFFLKLDQWFFSFLKIFHCWHKEEM